MVVAVNKRVPLAAGAWAVGLVLTGCGSGSSAPSASPTSTASATTIAPSPTTAPPQSTVTAAAVRNGGRGNLPDAVPG